MFFYSWYTANQFDVQLPNFLHFWGHDLIKLKNKLVLYVERELLIKESS